MTWRWGYPRLITTQFQRLLLLPPLIKPGQFCVPSQERTKMEQDRFQFLDSVKIGILSDEKRACHSYADEVCFYEADFTSGLCFPVHPFVRELFSYLHLALAQLMPNTWRIIVSCMVV